MHGAFQSALLETISNRACAFPSTSRAASRYASSFSRRPTVRRRCSLSALACDFFGRAGLVRRSASLSKAPA